MHSKFPWPRFNGLQLATSLAILLMFNPSVYAASDAEVNQLRDQVQQLMKRIEQLESKQQATEPAASNGSSIAESNQSTSAGGAPLLEAARGLTFGGGLTTVYQRAARGATTTSPSQFNYRLDLEAQAPLGQFSDNGPLAGAQGLLFTHVRIGQGQGIQWRNNLFTGNVNSVSFELNNPVPQDASVALLAQAWYQLTIPLGTNNLQDANSLEITVGKIDPFVFFDQNSMADDESEQFLNNVFVHNPLLDSGGDIGADSYGFSPGIRGAYNWNLGSGRQVQMSVGAFGAGNGASFQSSLSSPFVISQLAYTGTGAGGFESEARLYAWRNPASQDAILATNEVHQGYGFSVVHGLSEHVRGFARAGVSTRGRVNFDRAITGGVALEGSLWNREKDTLAVAVGRLRSSNDYRVAGNGTGSETDAEAYYAYRLSDYLVLSPSVQFIKKPAAVRNASSQTVLGFRAKASF